MNPIVEGIGLLGGAFGLFISVPQIVRIIRTKSHVGVSLSSWLIYFLSMSSWSAFGFRYHSPSQIISNTIALSFTGLLSWMLLSENFSTKIKFSKSAALALLLALGAACFVVVTFSPEPVVNVFLILFLYSRVPQVIESYKSFRQGRKTVVSMPTYALSALSAFTWIVYGILTGLTMIIVASSIVLGLSLLVFIFETLAQKKAQKITLSN